MDWIKVTIYTSPNGIEPVCDMLYDMGITGTQIEDESEFNEFLEENKQFWDYVDDELVEQKKGETRVIIYLEDNESFSDTVSGIKSSLSVLKEKNDDLGRLDIWYENLKSEDWENNWKKYFKPTEIGNKILIMPQWYEDKPDTDRTVFTVNPGMTFGSGTHHSTKLCIEHLENYISGGEKVLDIGCGSGILSIISLLLGADSALALDVDENCIHTAYENLEMNGLEREKYTVLAGNILSDDNLKNEIAKEKYDVVLANIVADVIIALSEYAHIFLKENGVFIVSGIIEERKNDVLSAIEKSKFTVADIKEKGGWVSIVCKL